MAFIVVYDACVLFPAPLRDFLLRLAQEGLVQAKWSAHILDECFDSIRRQRPDLSPERLLRTRNLMEQAARDCLVSGYEKLVETLELPDPGDRHVLAAAIQARAQIILTWNQKDFPNAVLAEYGVKALDPDQFVLGLAELNPQPLYEVLRKQAEGLRKPPGSVNDVLDTLEKQGLNHSVAKLRKLLSS